MGRQELLQWINEFTECDYPRIEQLSDGVAYCQVVDALHSGAINLSKLNFNARFPEDFSRNIKVLDDAFTKLRIEKCISIDSLSKGKFQENITFLQWLFNYAAKVGPFAMRSYKGYQRRKDAFDRQQHGRFTQMCAHLIPNSEFLKFKQTQQASPSKQEESSQEQYTSINQVGTVGNQLNRKIQFLDDQLQEMEGDLKNRMEYNWKLIYALDDMIYQREVLHGILQKIEQCVIINEQSDPVARIIMDIIKEVPEDFIQFK